MSIFKDKIHIGKNANPYCGIIAYQVVERAGKTFGKHAVALGLTLGCAVLLGTVGYYAEKQQRDLNSTTTAVLRDGNCIVAINQKNINNHFKLGSLEDAVERACKDAKRE